MKFRVIPDDPKWAPEAAVAEALLNHHFQQPGEMEKLVRMTVKEIRRIAAAKRKCWMCNQESPGGVAAGLDYHVDVSGTDGKVPCLAAKKRKGKR